ncbi:hypothetical protein GJAV_G00055590 [Gymnothorax javanicus]|nr:hypothetical protein GJAV_G00055590 [Gymnothorax javanicus]
MSYNKVKVINKDTLRGLRGLIRLHMDHNRIEFINPEAFYGLTALQLVQLEGNLLQQLHPDTFVTLRYSQIFKVSSIKNIYLSENALSSLPVNIFSHCTQLENLYLHGNPWSCDCRMEWFVEWAQRNAGILKCKRDRKYARGQLCPMCEFPGASSGKILTQVSHAALACAKPWISPHLKRKNITVDEGEYSPVSSHDFLAPIGSLEMNVTDQFHNEASVVCTVQRPSRMDNLTVLHEEDTMTLSVTVATSVICNIDYEHIQKLWRILATYSDSPMHLERGLLLAKTPEMIYRYQQRRPGQNEDELFTAIDAEIKASPAWLMQGEVTLQLDRTTTTFSTLHIKYTSTVQLRMENKAQKRDRYSWTMIKRDNLTKTEHSVLTGGVAELNCQTWGDPKPSIEWILPDGSKVRAPYSSEDRRIVITDSGRLTLRAADTTDSGLYRCIATNYLDADVLIFRITVFSPDVEEDDVNGAQLSHSFADKLFLDCESSGNPKAAIHWILPDHTVLDKSNGNKKIYKNGTLGIQELSERDRGFYRCLAGNYLGVDVVASQVTILGTKKNSDADLEGEGSGSELESNAEENESSQNELPSSDPSQTSRQESRTITSDKPYPRHRPFSHRRTSGDITQGRRGPSTRRRNWGARRVLSNASKRVDPQRWAEYMRRAQKGKTSQDEEKNNEEGETENTDSSEKAVTGTSGDEDLGSGENLIKEQLIIIPSAVITSTIKAEAITSFESETTEQPMVSTAPHFTTNRWAAESNAVTPVKKSDYHTVTPSSNDLYALERSTNRPLNLPVTVKLKVTDTVSEMLVRISGDNLETVTDVTPPLMIEYPNVTMMDSPGTRVEPVVHTSTDPDGQTTFTAVTTTESEQDEITFHTTQRIKSPRLPAGSTIISHQQIHIIPSNKPRSGRRRNFPDRRRVFKPSRINDIHAYLNRLKKTTVKPKNKDNTENITIPYTNELTTDNSNVEKKDYSASSEAKDSLVHHSGSKLKPNIHSSSQDGTEKPTLVEQRYTTSSAPYSSTMDNSVTNKYSHRTATLRVTELEPSSKVMASKPRIIGGKAASFTVLSNSDAFLPCEAVGNPKPTINWKRFSSGTGVTITISGKMGKFEMFKNGTLLIQNANIKDRGQYLCQAENEHGSEKLLVTLSVVSYPSRILEPKMRDIKSHTGDTVEIRCKSDGRPMPLVSWILANRTQVRGYNTDHGRVSVTPDGTLVIHRVTVFDRGHYKCIASNPAGADTATVRLQVVAAPPGIKEEKRQQVKSESGENLMLHCTAQGNPEPTVHWVIADGTTVRPKHSQGHKVSVFANGTLLIRGLAVSDSGKYECIATSSTGSERRVVSITVEQTDTMPQILEVSRRSTELKYGDRLLLNCSAVGEPAPRIFWRLPSKALVDRWHRMGSRIHVLENGTLIIDSVSEKDDGDYLCIARNKMGDDLQLMEVSVSMKPAKIMTKPLGKKQVPFGNDLKVDCKASGTPEPEISWGLPDGTVLNSAMQSDDSRGRTRRYILFNNGTLYFNKIGMTEEGDYTCYAENTLGKDEMHVHISVLTAAPRIRLPSRTYTRVKPGGNVRFDCEAVGEPKPKILWMLPSNDMIAASNERYLMHVNGSLDIRDVKQVDAGEYVCVARNAAGDDRKVYKLDIDGNPPIINGYHQNRTVVKDTATKYSRKLIDCKAQGSPPPQITWIMPDNIFLPAPYYGSRINIHPNGTLEIRNVRPTDTAEFICMARNDGGEAVMVVQLEVMTTLRRPIFKNPFNERVITRLGKTTMLNCSADGHPIPEISWLLPNGTRLTNDARTHRYHLASDGSLVIYNPSKEDTGKYRCSAKNKMGYIEKLVILEVGQKPYIVTRPRGIIRGVSGESLFLHCLTDGSPRPNIYWTIPGGLVLSRLQSTGRFQLFDNGTLVIREATLHDRGNYLCRAKNDMGEATLTVPVIVIAFPPRITNGPPSNLRTAAGVPMQLPCMAIGIPKPVISWELPDRSVLSSANKGWPAGTELLHPQGTLVIQNPTSLDSGTYKCMAKNHMGMDSRATYVRVL